MAAALLVWPPARHFAYLAEVHVDRVTVTREVDALQGCATDLLQVWGLYAGKLRAMFRAVSPEWPAP